MKPAKELFRIDIRKKVMLIVTASILLTVLPIGALIYTYALRRTLQNETLALEKVTTVFSDSVQRRFAQSPPKLAALAHILESELARPLQSSEVAAFHQVIERNPDGVWRNRRPGFDGKNEAGVFLPADKPLSDTQKVQHLRVKRTLDVFGAAATAPLENVWYLSPQRSEVIFDRAFPDFAFDQAADNDYTQTPWLTYTSPQSNPNREFRFTPPSFDPVPKVWMVSALYPVYVNGQWMGSLGEDMQMTSVLQNLLKDGQLHQDVHHFLLDAQGNFVLAGPWQKNLEAASEAVPPDLRNEPQLATMLASDLTGKPRLIGDSVMVQGKPYLAIGIQLNPLGWRYYRLTSVDEILSHTRELLLALLAMVLLMVALTGTLIGAAVGQSITRRILKLRDAMQAYSHDPQMRVSDAQAGRDEIGDAAVVFNEMADGIESSTARRTLAETEARTSEARLQATLDAVPDLLFEMNMEGRYLSCHSPRTDLLLAPAETLIDRLISEVMPAEAARIIYEGLLEALQKGYSSGRQIELPLPQGPHWFELSIAPKAILPGEERRVVVLSRDITERKLAARFEETRRHVLEMLTGSTELPAILEALVRGAEQNSTGGLCSILLMDAAGKHLGRGVAPSLPDFYNAALDGIEIGVGVGSCGTAAFTGERVIAEDIATHHYWAPYRELASRAGLAACWSEPIRASTGRIIGTFAIYHRVAHAPAQEDIAQIEQWARLASIAVERSMDAQKLRDSEAHFRLLTEEVSDVVWKTDRNNIFTYISPADERLRGFRADEVVGHHTFELFTEDGIGTINRTLMQRKAAGPHANRPASVSFEVQQHCKDGRLVWTEILSIAERDAHGSVTGYHGITRDITTRKEAAGSLQLAASVFSHAQEGILITTLDGAIIDVNSAFSRITGFSREEVLGRNPRMLNSGRQDKDFYVALFQELDANGQWHGEIWNRRKNGEIYVQAQTISRVNDAQGQAQHYVALFSDITDQKAHQSQLEHIAHFDALTNLPNRVLLADRLHQAMAQSVRRGEPLAVAFLDLDGFKSVNDQHGHDAGDQLLIALATRMRMALRDGDTLARMGGDEFVAVMVDLEDIASSVPLITRLLIAAAQPVQVGDLWLRVSASLGVTFYPQPQDVDADQLLRQADQAMYQAKLAGKNRYHVFDAAQDTSIRGHHESIEHIRQALEQCEFVLYYQPKVNMRTGAVIGAEALIRWQHPERGLLPPSAFLPAIEDHPLAVDIGEWVIDTALTQIELWRSSGLDIPVSINIGARQLQQSNFVARLQQLLAAHDQVAPGCLELEVLETSALEDLSKVSHVIRTCMGIGVSFALDDFGTGYSSLTYLKHLPVRMLKIDQSFVRDMLDDPDDLAILEGVVSLAAAFRRDVIAEGVETIAHGVMLLQLGCDLGQGYGIARPMPAAQFPAWAAAWQPDAAWNRLTVVQREDYPMLFASVEHRAWSRGMESFLNGKREAPPALDAEQCHLGQWLSKEGLARHGDQAAFATVDALHRKAHLLAGELCDRFADGYGDEARQRLGELHALRDALLDQLKALLPA